MIDPEDTAREKARLPRGWGRFGKSIDQLVALGRPDEELSSTCVGLNPSFEHRTITLAGGLMELTKSANLVLAATNRRLILIATGAAGAPRSDTSIDFKGLEIVEVSKRDLKLRWPEGEMKVKGIAKQMLAGFVDELRAQLESP